MLDMIRSHGSVPLMLKHMAIYSVAELLSRVVLSVEGSSCDWLVEIDIMGKLVDLLRQEESADVHANAAQVLYFVPRWHRLC